MQKLKPDGWPTVVPRIITADVPAVVAFLASVFHATGEAKTNVPSEIHMGDSLIMISDGGGLRPVSPSFLLVFVADADATYRRAMAVGSESIEAPADMPWGDRRATVRDPWGNLWQMETYRGL